MSVQKGSWCAGPRQSLGKSPTGGRNGIVGLHSPWGKHWPLNMESSQLMYLPNVRVLSTGKVQILVL